MSLPPLTLAPAHCIMGGMVTLHNPTTYEHAVEELAAAHADGAEDDLRIYLSPDPAQEVVRLVEVSASHPSEDPDAVTAPVFHFMPARDFGFHSAVVLLSEADWARMQADSLQLPAGWDTALQQVWPR